MAPPSFSINFDYRCPFARNANEHVLAALEAGAELDVTFKAFSLDQPHVAPGAASVWDDPAKRVEQLAVAAGIVVREQFAERFAAVHLALFAARHDRGEDLRDPAVISRALEGAGVDAQTVFAELDEGWPFEIFRAEHEEAVAKYDVFGVPTFIADDQAVFVRLMSRPDGNGAVARSTIARIVELLTQHPEINEYKHTTISQ